MPPTAELLDLPEGYGKPRKTLSWTTVRHRLEQAKQYWLTTVRADGRAHVVPLDGIWLGDVWYYGGSPATVHRRLVEGHPQAVMHLPDPWQVVIVEGAVRLTDTTPELAQRLVDTSNEKYAEYGYQADVGQYAQVLGLHPVRVRAWTSFPRDATRFTFGPRSHRGRTGQNAAMASYSLNDTAVAYARRLIDKRQYVLNSVWTDAQPSAEDENAYLGSHSWDDYARWHLGLTDGASDATKARYGFVYGDFRRLHRMGLIACQYRAAEWGHKEIELAAHELLQHLDGTKA